MLTAKVPQGQPVGPVRRRLREADASERPEHSPGVDGREAAKVEPTHGARS